ncbi:GST, gst [Phaffia rhodozyma]|uniref:GST, gst n=1 Tax=Phaffia rhodozyma TaxID=264483 RepID=A0A0F7SJX5_PHARH|nr:GST, gst [Phaffia rhodozyma]
MTTAALSLLPQDYGFVALAATSTFYLHVYQVLQVSKYRKLAKVVYPQFMAEKAQMDANPDAVKFNCAQRAHGNTLEILPHMLFGILFNGLFFPKISAALGACWVIGRILFTYGYVTGNPMARYHYGGQLHILGAIGTLVLATYNSAKLILPTL